MFHAKLARPVNAPSLIENEFIIGSAHPRTADRSADIWLTVLNVSDQLPYTGLLQINDRLYYVNQGKVRVTTAIQRDSVNLVVKKIQEYGKYHSIRIK